MRVLPFVLLAAMAGCAPVSNDAVQPPTVPDTTGDAALTGYRWTLEDANVGGRRVDALFPGEDHALTLLFADGRVSTAGGCNGMSGAYRIDADGRLAVGPLRATMKACAEPLMRADRALSELLSKPLAFAVQESMPPRLQLRAADGGTSTWVGEQTPEARYGSAGERVFLEVAPERVACNHPLIPDHRCLRVREIGYDEAGIKQRIGEWQPLYQEIEGFTFVEGERKVLRLTKFRRDPAPADASSVVYVLDMVVESERVAR
jgi:heat shock protein HslJ